jgi:hypothetical protein
MKNGAMIGLALGAGYVLGRTKKAKLAITIGTMAAGRRLAPSGALKSLVAEQLKSNPELKALGGQLRGDLGGVGKAAAGALVSRRIEKAADLLHDRTQGVQDRIRSAGEGDSGDADDEESDGEEDAGEDSGEAAGEEKGGEGKARPKRKAPARKSTAGRATKKAPAKKSTAKKTTARGGTSGRAPARSASRGAASKGGRDHG